MARNKRQRSVSDIKPALSIPDGYELVEYTLRRVCDGVIRTHRVKKVSNTQKPAVLPAASSTYEQPHQNHQGSPAGELIDSLPPTQIHDPPRRRKYSKRSRSTHHAQGLSARTQERNAYSRGDGYTVVCGVESPEIEPPQQRLNNGNGEFYCPRCMSNFTREKTVKDHFPHCISKYGNPEGLCFTDHPSMEAEDRKIMEVEDQRLKEAEQTSGRGSSLENAGGDEEMYDAQ